MNSTSNRLIELLCHPREWWYKVVSHYPQLITDDRKFLEYIWKHRMDYPLNIDYPTTFNEKLQWLKIYDRRPEYTTMVDKYAVKDYVAGIIGKEYIIPTLGVWDKVKDIDWEKLPNQFVLKCTHDSGGIVICRDKKTLDKKATKKKLKKSLKRDYYLAGREWPYKNVPRRIIAEEYIETGNNIEGLIDYKFMSFNGKVKCCFTCTRRYAKEGLRVTFYDNNWNILPFERSHPKETTPCQKPYCYEQMKIAAEKLSENLPFARIDFYEIDHRPYFGEITLYPGNGYEAFQPMEWDIKLGEWIELPKV